MKRQLWISAALVLAVLVCLGCLPQDVKISGRLSLSGNGAQGEASATGYKAMLVALADGRVEIAETDAQGNFEFEARADSEYLVRFLDEEYQSAGGLAVTVNPTEIVVGFNTGSEDVDLGEILLDTATGLGVAAQNGLSKVSATDASCEAVDGEPAGDFVLGLDSDGVDGEHAGEEDTDGDCVPNVFDADDNNNDILDDQDGDDGIIECPNIRQVTLFMNNKVENSLTSASPTGEFIVITIHVEPVAGKVLDSVMVSGPSYMSSLVFGDSGFYDSPVADGTPFLNGLVECMGGSQRCAFLKSDGSVNLADVMAAGDTFVFEARFTDGTSTTCPRMINSVLEYTPYNLRIGDDDDAVASLAAVGGMGFKAPDLDGDGKFKMAFDIPAGTQLGFVYRFDLTPLNSSCNPEGEQMSFPDLVAVDPSFLGDTRVHREDGLQDVEVIIDTTDSVNWPASVVDAWEFDITMQDMTGDNAAATGVRARVGASTCE